MNCDTQDVAIFAYNLIMPMNARGLMPETVRSNL